MAISPAFTGFFWCFAAMVLLLFVSVSAPTWHDIYFLGAWSSSKSTEIRYGIFGYCVVGGSGGCSKHSLGYDITLSPIGVDYSAETGILKNFTKVMVLHPIAGALALLSVLWGFLGVCMASRACTILMSLTAFLALLATLVVFAIDLILWLIVRSRIRDHGYHAGLGNANWLTAAAAGALILGACTAACGSCGRFATGRMGGEKY